MLLVRILQALPDVKDHSEFLLASECSLKVDSETKHDEDKVHKSANKFGTMTLVRLTQFDIGISQPKKTPLKPVVRYIIL